LTSTLGARTPTTPSLSQVSQCGHQLRPRSDRTSI
jgi:hypothetical protein